MTRIAHILLAIALLAAPALAEKRVAFVVGNSNYEHSAPLRNPVRDANLVSATLTDLGFDVRKHLNLTRRDIGAEFIAFLRETEGADVTLFYFAGHGMQFEDRNYLLGTDAKLESEFDVDAQSVNLDLIVAQLQRHSRAALVFVDACRDNPLASAFYRKTQTDTRAVATRGLAPVRQAHDGAMIVFSASPGQVAYDGSGEASPFATALADHLPTENMEVLSVMKRIIRDVKAATADLQTPMVTNDLTTEIYLNEAAAPVAVAPATGSGERAMFDAVRSVGTVEAWDLFLQRHPDGQFADLARLERARLAAVAAVEAAKPAPEPEPLPVPEPVPVAAAPAEAEEDASGIEIAAAVAPARRVVPEARPLEGDALAPLRAKLLAEGFEGGEGLSGLRSALSAFQKSKGLAPSGILTAATVEQLGLPDLNPETLSKVAISDTRARRYSVETLTAAAADPRIVDAAKVLRAYPIVWGTYDNRVYVAVETFGIGGYDAAKRLASLSGGKLADLETAKLRTSSSSA